MRGSGVIIMMNRMQSSLVLHLWLPRLHIYGQGLRVCDVVCLHTGTQHLHVSHD
jgi:hypothetical protein